MFFYAKREDEGQDEQEEMAVAPGGGWRQEDKKYSKCQMKPVSKFDQ